jgi:hypothetical protein
VETPTPFKNQTNGRTELPLEKSMDPPFNVAVVCHLTFCKFLNTLEIRGDLKTGQWRQLRKGYLQVFYRHIMTYKSLDTP